MSWLDVPSSAAQSRRSYGTCLPSTTYLMRQEAIHEAKGAENQIVDRPLTAELEEPDAHPQP